MFARQDRPGPIFLSLTHIFSPLYRLYLQWQNEINSFCFLHAGEVVFVISPFLWLPVSQREYTGYCTGLHWHTAKSEGDKYAHTNMYLINGVRQCITLVGSLASADRYLNYLVVLMSEEISKNLQHMLGVLCTLQFTCIIQPSVWMDQTNKQPNTHTHTHVMPVPFVLRHKFISRAVEYTRVLSLRKSECCSSSTNQLIRSSSIMAVCWLLLVSDKLSSANFLCAC